MANGLDELLNLPESALRVREARQELLASNIANADTPNYKARDINFSTALQQVSHAAQAKLGIQAPLALTTTSEGHQTGKIASPMSDAIQYRNDIQGRIDGNDVDTDKERMQFADNGLRYEAAVTLVTAQIHNMLAVIQA
ncbi:flagellar basal body rod protein FlgB [Solimicrobium silvestre]|uniref:Flagellar basal body rod protein FlgB n=1 Tax=Solimicrobium silvestre TaxID=2099400 RepID=A0A2S9GVU5_9BURK|nr:flagellar basal body rod protein FlgB [Solimicrobium silvestre]PRC91830.1 FlgB: flagellar basal-body rod protein FlgB [Solimicrobium silvestre]